MISWSMKAQEYATFSKLFSVPLCKVEQVIWSLNLFQKGDCTCIYLVEFLNMICDKPNIWHCSIKLLIYLLLVNHFANKGSYSHSYGFSSRHVQMWVLDHKEGWTSKNWCFQIVMLEKTLESPLVWEIKPVIPKGQSSLNGPCLFSPPGFWLNFAFA